MITRENQALFLRFHPVPSSFSSICKWTKLARIFNKLSAAALHSTDNRWRSGGYLRGLVACASVFGAFVKRQEEGAVPASLVVINTSYWLTAKCTSGRA